MAGVAPNSRSIAWKTYPTSASSPRAKWLAAGEFEWLQLLTHPEIWVYDGQTMRETMESMLAASREERWSQLERDRIDLS